MPTKAKDTTADNGPIVPAEEDYSMVTSAPDEWEFETVAEESGIKVVFENVGDVFVGQYIGVEHIEPENGKDEPFDLLTFRGRDQRLYSVNTSYKLSRAMEKVTAGDWVRITYVKAIATGRAEPLKDYRVEVKK